MIHGRQDLGYIRNEDLSRRTDQTGPMNPSMEIWIQRAKIRLLENDDDVTPETIRRTLLKLQESAQKETTDVSTNYYTGYRPR
jgi:hypothetical protein